MNGVNRRIDYLRISVTDRCNMRCIYCIPKEGIVLKPQDEILSFEEVLRLTQIFASLGISKVRLTGGEPLVRKGLIGLINSLVKIEGIEEIALTTNGILLSSYAESLKEAGIKRINISLDTLDETKFETVTGSPLFHHVMEGIQKAKDVGLEPIKLNTVIMRGINDGEITDFVEFAVSKGLTLRFIEFMKVTPLWREKRYVSLEEIKDVCNKRFKLKRIGNMESSPAEYYEIRDRALLGFIKTDENNCRNCNRLRLASTGELRICLYEENGISLKEFLRNGCSNEEIKDIIVKTMGMKQHANYSTYEPAGLYMCSIGG